MENEIACPFCGLTHPVTAQFCPKTGQKISAGQFCPYCGKQVQSSWRVCAFCGHQLSAEISTVQTITRQKGKIGAGIILVFGAIALLLVGVGVVMWFLYPDSLGSIFEPSRVYPFPSSPTFTVVPAAISEPFTCTDAIGCVDIGPTDPIHIAYLLVVAGPNETLGVDSRNGIEIAIDDAGGKILNHDIKFDGEDGGCSAEGGQAAGTKLAADPTIVAVIGTSCSSEARAALPLLSQAGFVVISPSNTAPDLTEAGNPNNYPGYLRTAHNDLIQGAVAAKYAYEAAGIKKAATIHDGSLYADKLQQVFAENFAKMGGTITLQTAVDPNQTDMSSVLADIAAGGPEMIYYPIFLPAGGLIISQAKTTPGLENVLLMGADGLFSPDVVSAAGDAVEGFHVSSSIVSGPAYDAFKAKYQAKFGTEPISIFHAHAYDAFMMVKAAIEKVAVVDADGTIHIGRQALRDAMFATKGFQGLTGVLTCTPTGDCANPVIGVYEYHKGTYPPVLIWSSPSHPSFGGAWLGLPNLSGRIITVAVENAYPPFNNFDVVTGEGIGWDYDVVREICKRLNCVSDFKQAAWDGIFPAMQAGEYDLLADGVPYTVERDAIVDFSIPYMTVGQVMLVRLDDAHTIDDFKTNTALALGTQSQTPNEAIANETFGVERVQSFGDFSAAILALVVGDIDGVVIDNVSGANFSRAYEGKLKIGFQITTDEQLAFVFPPGSDLIGPVNAALQSMMDDGTLAQFNKKWGLIQ